MLRKDNGRFEGELVSELGKMRIDKKPPMASAGGGYMAEPLCYESAIEHAKELRARRIHRFVKLLFLAYCVLTIAIAVVIGKWIYHDTHITDYNSLTITNNTSAPISDAAFFSIIEVRFGSTGKIPAGQTVRRKFEYKENDCPSGFVYDQGGQSFYVPMSGDNIADGECFQITINPGRVISKGKGARTDQIPSTQPIAYLH